MAKSLDNILGKEVELQLKPQQLVSSYDFGKSLWLMVLVTTWESCKGSW